MADVRVLSTGKPFYRIDGGVVALLQEMFPEALEKIESKAFNVTPALARSAKESWRVQKHPFGGNWEILYSSLNGEVRYPGPNVAPTVAGAKAAFAAIGHPCPQPILGEYAAKLAGNVDLETQSEIAREKRARLQYQQEEKDASASRKITG